MAYVSTTMYSNRAQKLAQKNNVGWIDGSECESESGETGERSLLLSALDTRTLALLIIIAHVALFGSCLLAGIHLCEADLLNVGTLREGRELGCWGEDRTELLDLGDVGPVGGGELDLELDVQVTKVVVSLGGHTLSHHSLQIT